MTLQKLTDELEIGDEITSDGLMFWEVSETDSDSILGRFKLVCVSDHNKGEEIHKTERQIDHYWTKTN